MFYMGGMTLGYFSPHPEEACASDATDHAVDPVPVPAQVSVSVPAGRLKSLLEYLKPEQTPSHRQPTAWPIHVFY